MITLVFLGRKSSSTYSANHQNKKMVITHTHSLMQELSLHACKTSQESLSNLKPRDHYHKSLGKLVLIFCISMDDFTHVCNLHTC